MRAFFKVLLAYFIVQLSLSGQQTIRNPVDSLQSELQKAKSPAEKALLHYKIGIEYAKKKDFARAEKCAVSVLSLSKQHNYGVGIGKYYDLKGEIEFYQNEHSQSLVYFTQSLSAMKKANDKQGIAYAYRQLGLTQAELGNDSLAGIYWWKSLEAFKAIKNAEGYRLAVEKLNRLYLANEKESKSIHLMEGAVQFAQSIHDSILLARFTLELGRLQCNLNPHVALINLKQCEKLFKALKDEDRLSDTYQYIGVTYDYVNDLDKALKYLSLSLKIREKIGDRNGMGQNYNSIGNIYLSRGNSRNALRYFELALAIFQEPNREPWGIPWTLTSLAMVDEFIANNFLKSNNIDSANYYFYKAITRLKLAAEGWQKEGMSSGLGDVYSALGRIYLSTKNYTLSELYVKKAIDVSHRNQNIGALSYNHFLLSSLDTIREDYKEAFHHFAKHVQFRDSLKVGEHKKNILKLELTHEYAAKEANLKAKQEMELQWQRTLRNSIFIGFVVVLFFAVIFLFQRNMISKEKRISEIEKEKSNQLLLNILPHEVAEELKAKGEAEAKFIDQVTVLFTDFKGFTEISEKLSPKELLEDLNHCFSAFDNIIEKHGLEKIKTIGDSYMAAGGLPSPNYTHAEDAVRAALEMRDYISAIQAEKVKLGQPYFEVRIGIHTGPVVAGIVGVKKFAYDIWGDTVNTASRMESNSEPGKVNVSEATYEAVKNKFSFTHRGKILAKGKGEIDMYFVENIHVSPSDA